MILIALAALCLSAFAAHSAASGGCSCRGGGADVLEDPREVTVTFDSQGGVPDIQVEKALEGRKIHTPEPPVRHGYAFDEWYREPECLNEFDFDENYVYADATLYAKWCAADEDGNAIDGSAEEEYWVRFDSRGGSPVRGQTVREGFKAIEPSPPSNGSLTFSGWFKEPACVNEWDFSRDRVYSDAVLYAKWRQGVAVTFDYQMSTGGDSYPSKVVFPGEPFSLPAPTRAPYTFGGWYDGVGGVNSVLGGQGDWRLEQAWPSIGVTGNSIELHAYWLGTPGLLYRDIGQGERGVSVGSANAAGLMVIQEWFLGEKVTQVASKAFNNRSSITGAHIPDTVERIEYSAFNGCGSLASVNLPSGLKYIGDHAFDGCRGMADATVPDGVAYLGEYAFNYCTGLKSASLPDSLAEVRQFTFQNCSGLESVRLPGALAGIGKSAFSSCIRLKSVSMPDTVTFMDSAAFMNCQSLEAARLSSGLKVIANDTFNGCPSLKTVNIPDGVAAIGTDAFNKCSSLADVFIPLSVTSIGPGVFKGCDQLTIRAETGSQPPGWVSGWNGGRGVLWGQSP